MRVLFFSSIVAGVLLAAPAESSPDIYRMISAAASRHGVSVSIALKVAKIESGFDCAARGKAGELGPFQIKPATARLIGYQGAESALRSCGAGLEWGVKHLAMAIRAGGVWKHNQGLWAKRKSSQAAAYEQKVMLVSLPEMRLHAPGRSRAIPPRRGPLRATRPSQHQAAYGAQRHFP
ncbi:MAG TPA: transglycosylase SLT domain-containing protein [Aestuariivirgaceae bacterium]|jgi:hypothetical protein